MKSYLKPDITLRNGYKDPKHLAKVNKCCKIYETKNKELQEKIIDYRWKYDNSVVLSFEKKNELEQIIKELFQTLEKFKKKNKKLKEENKNLKKQLKNFKKNKMLSY